jgi:hypothetical protein
VKIGDGCATVTDYKLPLATVPLERAVAGRRERGYARSQDIGLVVLVVVPERSQLLRQEKDEASLFASAKQDS